MHETDPVIPSEQTLRRIPNKKDWIDLSLPIPIHRKAFRPYKQDIDGLSVYRELFVSAPELAEAGDNPAGYCVSSLLVEHILLLGLSVIANPQEDQLPGHALIPELNYSDCTDREKKKVLKGLQLKLAILASKNIVLAPELIT